MFTPKSVVVILILLFIGLAFWSKLRFVDPEHHQQQRWRIEQYPGFKQTKQTDDRSRNELLTRHLNMPCSAEACLPLELPDYV